jgi:hypothetical protein
MYKINVSGKLKDEHLQKILCRFETPSCVIPLTKPSYIHPSINPSVHPFAP